MNKFNSSPGHVQFLDGPARGKKFRVRRAPMLLRVVSTTDGRWDVLDLVTDTPRDNEEIHIYSQESWMHVRANDREHSGFYYNYVHVPIDGTLKATLRHTERWQEWAKVQAAELEANPQGRVESPSTGANG